MKKDAEKDFGVEAIEELMRGMDQGEVCMVFAGYCFYFQTRAPRYNPSTPLHTRQCINTSRRRFPSVTAVLIWQAAALTTLSSATRSPTRAQPRATPSRAGWWPSACSSHPDQNPSTLFLP